MALRWNIEKFQLHFNLKFKLNVTLNSGFNLFQLSRLCSDDSIELLQPTKESRKMTFKDIEDAPKAARIFSKTTVLSFQQFVLLVKLHWFKKKMKMRKKIFWKKCNGIIIKVKQVFCIFVNINFVRVSPHQTINTTPSIRGGCSKLLSFRPSNQAAKWPACRLTGALQLQFTY